MSSKDSRKWHIRVSNRQKCFKIDHVKLKRIAVKILCELESCPLPCGVSELSLLITDNAHIRRLNLDFRGKDRPTDVLSFSQLEGEYGNLSLTLGDIVISLEYADSQAKKREIRLDEEVLRLLVHGILHLHGFDHEGVPDSERKRMKRMENRLQEMFRGSSSGLVTRSESRAPRRSNR